MSEYNGGIQGSQARAAMATGLLFMRESVTIKQIMDATGIRTRRGALFLVDNISLCVPIYEVEQGVYALNRDGIRDLLE